MIFCPGQLPKDEWDLHNHCVSSSASDAIQILKASLPPMCPLTPRQPAAIVLSVPLLAFQRVGSKNSGFSPFPRWHFFGQFNPSRLLRFLPLPAASTNGWLPPPPSIHALGRLLAGCCWGSAAVSRAIRSHLLRHPPPFQQATLTKVRRRQNL
jgi:hypothetical protein